MRHLEHTILFGVFFSQQERRASFAFFFGHVMTVEEMPKRSEA